MHNRAQHQMLLCWCSLAVLIWSSKAFTLSNADERLRAFVPLTIHPSPPQLLPTQLRHKHILLMYAPRKGAPMRLRVEFVQIGRYTDEIVATVSRVRTARLVLRSKTRGGPDKGVLHFPAPHRGIIPVQLDTHSNAAIVTALPPYAWLSIEASE
ncbi:MAG TPA: hypothetical protein EYP10_07410, partial [Armatimonadetes bacterium]|nr:hypothetical protein [Armatimonadota bacterium]